MRENVKHMLSAGADWRRPDIREIAIDPVAVALVLVAAVVHASWNRVLHAEDDRVAAMSVAGLVVGVILLPAVILSPPWRALPSVVAPGVTTSRMRTVCRRRTGAERFRLPIPSVAASPR